MQLIEWVNLARFSWSFKIMESLLVMSIVSSYLWKSNVCQWRYIHRFWVKERAPWGVMTRICSNTLHRFKKKKKMEKRAWSYLKCSDCERSSFSVFHQLGDADVVSNSWADVWRLTTPWHWCFCSIFLVLLSAQKCLAALGSSTHFWVNS